MTFVDKIILLLWVHTVADFVFQTNKMAINKSTSIKWLSSHVLVYTLPLFLFGWQFAIVNGLLHFCVDFVTSRMTSYLWKKEKRHAFFIVIGFDQVIHVTCLIKTLEWFQC